MNYKVLNTNEFILNDYSLVPLRNEDIFLIKEWRNAQIDVLRQNKILTDTDQENYFTHVIIPTFTQEAPCQILFSFLKSGKCIGYGGLTNIDWESKRTEMSFLLDKNRSNDSEIYKNDFNAYISLLKVVTFRELKFNRLFVETFDIRPLHVSILESTGFVFEGRMKQHVVINGKFADSLIHGFLKEYYNA
jgi:RimJ/RimL family protein N-acetyltransferase